MAVYGSTVCAGKKKKKRAARMVDSGQHLNQPLTFGPYQSPAVMRKERKEENCQG